MQVKRCDVVSTLDPSAFLVGTMEISLESLMGVLRTEPCLAALTRHDYFFGKKSFKKNLVYPFFAHGTTQKFNFILSDVISTVLFYTLPN